MTDNADRRCWYHVATPFEINKDWPDAHLYEVTTGAGPTPLTDTQRDWLITSIRLELSGHKFDKRLSLGNGRALAYKIPHTDISIVLCFLLITQEDYLQQQAARQGVH